MFWNKKEDEKKVLPDLPPAQSFTLPNDIPAQPLTRFPDIPTETTPVTADETEAFSLSSPPIRRTQELDAPIQSSTKPRSTTTKQDEVFVKLDKFQSARKALNTAQQQIEEIADTLKRIRETKLREEQELASWEKEVTAAKAKIDEINGMLFEKL